MGRGLLGSRIAKDVNRKQTKRMGHVNLIWVTQNCKNRVRESCGEGGVG